MMYLYILKSEAEGGFYVSSSEDPWIKLTELNSTESQETYTGRHRPWILQAVFEIKEGTLSPKQIATFIKRHQQDKLIEKLIEPDFIPSAKLSQLVRVDHVKK
jgi:hypothetical protein